jgi:Cu/Ag efflux protein CusF
MKKLTIIFLALLLSVFFVTSAFSAEKTASSKNRQITGNVTAIDTKANTVTVEKKNKEVTLNVGEDTKIIECTLTTEMIDIMIGDKLTAKYKESGNKNTATSITIREDSSIND